MVPIRTISVEGYRSVQRVFLRLTGVNAIVGPNGSGKSNLYRSLYLLWAAANGRLAQTLAQEGGMPSALWAGQWRKDLSKRISIAVSFDHWTYRFVCGLAQPSESAFTLDPFVREESLLLHEGDRRIPLFQRTNGSAHLRDNAGERVKYPMALNNSESILSELREPHRYPELSEMRELLLAWRFYHHFRTDFASPLRRPQIAVCTPVLGHDGADLAAALQTISEIGDSAALEAAVSAALAGAELDIEQSPGGLEIQLRAPEFRRPFQASELSDGTLKYLCLLAALLSPRPPSLLAFNEPDASLHPQLYEPLVQAMAHSAANSQLWITTHSPRFAELLQQHADAQLIRLEKQSGATVVWEDTTRTE